MSYLARTLAAALLSLVTVTAAAAQDGVAERILTVTGQGEVTAAPDMASLQLGVSSEAASAAEALAANSEAMTQVMALLVERGIAERDLQTSNFSVQPVYDRPRDNTVPRLRGYMVRNTLFVRVRDLDALGGILDAVVRDGANTLSGLSFGLSEPEAQQRAAEAAAVADALGRAQVLAEAAGVALGPVLRIDASGGGDTPRPMLEMAARSMDSADVPIAAGELAMRAQVRMTFALRD